MEITLEHIIFIIFGLCVIGFGIFYRIASSDEYFQLHPIKEGQTTARERYIGSIILITEGLLIVGISIINTIYPPLEIIM